MVTYCFIYSYWNSLLTYMVKIYALHLKGEKKLDVSLSLEFVSHYYVKFTIMSFSFVHIKIDINIVILKFYIS